MELTDNERMLIGIVRSQKDPLSFILRLLGYASQIAKGPDFIRADENLKLDFEKARKLYPGTKLGLDREWQNFTKKYKKDYPEIVPLLLPAIHYQIAYRQRRMVERQFNLKIFIPEWKNFSTWINNSCWTEEYSEYSARPVMSIERTRE